MTLDGLALVLASAAIHVGWNALARARRATPAFPWMVSVAGALLLLPLLLARRIERPFEFDSRLLVLAALSALFEAVYFVLLQSAYDEGELSVVYPLSRGIAPLLALAPARLWTGDGASARELAGIVAVLLGTAAIAGSAGGRRGSVLAILVGAATAAYQLVDRRAMQLAPAGAEVDFLAVMQLFLAAFLSAWWWRRSRRAAAPIGRIGPRDLRAALLAALGVQAAYFLILLALRSGNVALVAAARNAGIPLSLLAGALFLRERVRRERWIGALLIVAGVTLTLAW